MFFPHSKKGVVAMKVATVIEQALEGHRTKLKDMGATVVWQGRPAEIEMGTCGEEVGQALSEMIDGALQALGAGDERRLVVWARNAHGGVIVGVEYWGGSSEESQRPQTPSEGQERRALQSLAESRRLVEKCGGRIFVRAFECGSVRFVMELPCQTGGLA
jgi:C4-dicarboxylate-specific signal transduction histidine kinase